MKKSDALRHISRQIGEIMLVAQSGHRSNNFTKWRRDTEVTLGEVFGFEHQNVSEFSNIGYSPIASTRQTSDSVFERRFQSGLAQAKSTLESMLTEIERYWPDDAPQTNALMTLEGAVRRASIASKETAVTTSETKVILFMDVSGWSKLKTIDIKRYVEIALPQIKPLLVNADFLNTWGDAIVATFNSAKQAAETALNIRDFFTRATAEQGVPEGLVCRISLHQGEILLCRNALTGTQDIFGHAVHVAARLEPATAPRHVFCTDTVARTLKDIGGLGPKAWHLGALVLPKSFGEIDASVVTWANDADPLPGLQDFLKRTDASNALSNP